MFHQNSVDDKIEEAIHIVIEAEQASTSLLQRRLKVGYARAGKMVDDMEQMGIIDSNESSKPRKVLINYNEWHEKKDFFLNKIIERNNNSVYKKTAEYINNQNNLKENCEISFDEYIEEVNCLNKLENILLPSSKEKSQKEFLLKLLNHVSNTNLKIILCDDNLIFNNFNESSHLLIPIISDLKKVPICINWLLAETRIRLDTFSKYNCTNIATYNELVFSTNAHKRMPYILLVIQEMYSFDEHLDKATDKELIQILLKSKITGIKIIGFSKFSVNNLSIGIKKDLFNIETTNELLSIFDSINQAKVINITNELDGYKFELICSELLKKNGFTNINVTKSSNDYGADIIAIKDHIKYAIQCKRYCNPVGVTAVQEVIASKSIYNCHVAVVLTNSIFTMNAKELANKNGVLLWDRDTLNEMINKK